MSEKEERLLDLLCRKAIGGLNEQETRELAELERTVESPVDLQSLELTAAAISTAGVRPDDKLPDHLKAGILAQADDFFKKQTLSELRPAPVEPVAPARSPWWGWLGWAAAAVASILLIANIWSRIRRDPMSSRIHPHQRPNSSRLRRSATSLWGQHQT
jgi:hypothetical protein